MAVSARWSSARPERSVTRAGGDLADDFVDSGRPRLDRTGAGHVAHGAEANAAGLGPLAGQMRD